MIPARFLPITVTLVHPASVTDRYNNTVYDYGPAATRTSIAVWIDQLAADDLVSNGRTPITGGWKLITNHLNVDADDRVEWDAETFELDGPAWPVYTPAGVHHIEARLRRVEG